MGATKKRLVADRFEIEAEAGAGGAGTVYRALDLTTGERVALKVLRTVMDAGAPRFLREAQTLAKVAHPGVVRHVAHGVTHDGEPFLAMEWLEGRDLRRHLAEEGLTIAQTVALAADVADALAAVHALGVLHRDVKPSNIFLVGQAASDAGPAWAVKLIDLGLVRLEDVSHSLTRTGVAVGTPGYMAPEQARGDRDVGPAADVFSLGCVIFKCLTGQAPFEGDHLVAVLTKVLLSQPLRVRSLRPEVPDALDALVARMLAKDPAARPASAAEVAQALRTLAAGLADPPDLASPPRSIPFAGLTESEQRVAAVLLVGTEMDAPGDEAIRSVADRFGAHVERLAGGTRIIPPGNDPSALDQAARLARCALSLLAVLPRVPLALATGFRLSSGTTSSSAAPSTVIDRAAMLLAAPPDASGIEERSQQPAPRTPAEPRRGIVLDAVTADMLDGQFEVVRHEGIPGGLLVGLRDAFAGGLAARTLLGRPTPCLGREWELSTVASQLGDVVDESRAAALVFTAPAGMGKSRLAKEAVDAQRRRRPDLDVWIGRAEAARDGSSLGLVGQVLRSACDLRSGEPAAEQRRKVAARVAASVATPDRERVAELLSEMVGLPTAEPSPALQAARVDPPLGAEQMRRAFIDFLAAAAAAHPVLVVLDDLQWGDGPSIRFFEAALAELSHAPWMVLALARPEIDERFPRLWAGRHAQHLRLKPLSRKPTERLLRLALGDVPEEVTSRLVELAEGNVFFLEELIRGVAGAGKGAFAGVPLSLPQTVIGVVQARLDGLDAGVRRLLRAASVFGEAFWPGGVTALLGGMSTPAEDWPAQLVAAELVAPCPESRFAGEPELCFRNALLREGAYAMLTDRDRATGHLLAGAWMEEHGEPDPLVLAHHFERGGDSARAAVHTLRAAEQARGKADLDTAVARVDRALALGLPDAARLHALGLRCEALTWAASWSAAAATAAEVLAVARPGSAPWARAAVAKQSYALINGNGEELMDVITALWGAVPEPSALGTVLSALTGGLFFLCMSGRFVTASRLLDRVDELYARLPVADAGNEGRANVCHAIVASLGSGDPDLALRRAEAACECYRRAGDPAHLAFAQLFLGVACWQLGMVGRARREMAAISAAGPRAALTAGVRSIYEALALIDAGALDEALAVAERADRVALSFPAPATLVKQGEALWIRAEVALHAGDLAAAERDARAALERVRSYGVGNLSIQILLAAVLLAGGRVAEAVDLVREPLAALEAQGGRGFRAARTRLVAARVFAAAGRPDEARRTLRVARSALLARAAKIGDAGRFRSFLSDVPENAETLALGEAWLVTGGSSSG